MTEGTKRLKTIDYTYIIEETIVEMNESAENLSKLITEQERLVKIIQDSEAKEDFKAFTEELSQKIDALKEKHRVITYRANLLATVKDNLNSNESKVLVSMLLETLGIANGYAKSLEARIENKEDVIEVE